MAPSCSGGATQISWGAQGPTGPQGPVGQASVVTVAPSSAFASACPQAPGVSSDDFTSPLDFLNIPSIPGESTDPNHLNQINVSAWSLGVTGSGNGAGCAGTGSAGQGTAGEQLIVVKSIDKASPLLMHALTAGTNLGTVTLAVTKAAGEYLDYTFTGTIVSSVQWLGTGGGSDIPMEQVTFKYQSLTNKYEPENADGTLGSPILSCFNFTSGQEC